VLASNGLALIEASLGIFVVALLSVRFAMIIGDPLFGTRFDPLEDGSKYGRRAVRGAACACAAFVIGFFLEMADYSFGVLLVWAGQTAFTYYVLALIADPLLQRMRRRRASCGRSKRYLKIEAAVGLALLGLAIAAGIAVGNALRRH
jgi:hypothetical protein